MTQMCDLYRRILCLILAFIFLLALPGCGKSKAQRELEQAQEAARNLEEAAQRAQKEYYDLQRDIERYNDSVDRLYGN